MQNPQTYLTYIIKEIQSWIIHFRFIFIFSEEIWSGFQIFTCTSAIVNNLIKMPIKENAETGKVELIKWWIFLTNCTSFPLVKFISLSWVLVSWCVITSQLSLSRYLTVLILRPSQLENSTTCFESRPIQKCPSSGISFFCKSRRNFPGGPDTNKKWFRTPEILAFQEESLIFLENEITFLYPTP